MTEQGEEVTRAGLAIDPWKQKTFEKHLLNAGYSWQILSPMPHMVTMLIETTDPEHLARVIQIANEECARNKKKLHH